MRDRACTARLLLLMPWLCWLWLSSAAAPAASTGSAQLPALVQPPSDQHLVGKIVWLDLVTPALAPEEQFYRGLFGWSFQDTQLGPRHYAIASVDGRPVAGLLERPLAARQQRQPEWLTFISVPDLQAARRSALAQGAKLLAPPRNYLQRGQQAVFADPDGAVFAVLDSANGDPADALAAPGEWIWSALLSRDPEQEAGFYQTVFGYEVFGLEDDSTGAEHLLLSSQGYARAGVDSLPNDAQRRRAHWLNFVRVADVAASVTQAAQLGGRLLVPPRLGRHGDRLAVVADPSGAAVGLMQWSEHAGDDGPGGNETRGTGQSP